MNKETIINAVKELDNEINLDELIEKLIFIDKVEKGIKDVEEGKTKTHEEVLNLVKKW